jgi:hypothetical protein
MFLEEQGLRSIMDVVVKGDDVEMLEPRDALASECAISRKRAPSANLPLR